MRRTLMMYSMKIGLIYALCVEIAFLIAFATAGNAGVVLSRNGHTERGIPLIDGARGKELLQKRLVYQTSSLGETNRENVVPRDTAHIPRKSDSFKLPGNEYDAFKKWLQKTQGLEYQLTASLLGQRGAPRGRVTAWQTQYDASVDWQLFQSKKWGSGRLQMEYALVQYWGKSAALLNQNIGVASGVNDDSVNARYFSQMNYTHAFQNRLGKVSILVGQYGMSGYDGGDFNANQQVNFLNEALSQNGSATYPIDSFGGAIQVEDPTQLVSVIAGAQDGQNVSGEKIQLNHLSAQKMTVFSGVTVQPRSMTLGKGMYQILLYHQPSVSEQPVSSVGWSLNFQQYFGRHWVAFARANGVNKTSDLIRQSYVIGGVWLNPFQRNPLDQMGVAVAVNRLNKTAVLQGFPFWRTRGQAPVPSQRINQLDSPKSVESVFETYYAFGISSLMTVTPDVQIYLHPAGQPHRTWATAFSLRATCFF